MNGWFYTNETDEKISYPPNPWCFNPSGSIQVSISIFCFLFLFIVLLQESSFPIPILFSHDN